MRTSPKWPKLAATCILACAAATPLTSQATNGYFLIGYGAKSRSMGGTGIANPQDAMAAAANPAGMTEAGSGVIIGGEFFFPYREVAAENGEFGFQTPDKDAASASNNKSGANVFLIPSMGGVYKFNRRMSIGMSVIGNGANTRYDNNFFDLTGLNPGDSYGTLGVSLIQMQMLPTVAYRLTKNHSVGASLTLGVQQFRAYGLGNFNATEFQFSSANDFVTNKGNDYSYGAGVRVGWLGKFFDKKLNLGAYYASRTYMTKFRRYKGLFAEGGGFDIPEHYGVGLAFKPMGDKFTLAADVVKIRYSTIKSVSNTHPTTSLQSPCSRPLGLDPNLCGPNWPGGTPVPTSRALGENDGFGFGWKDMTVYKVGASYKLNDRLTLRAGYNYGKSPIPDNQLLFNLLAPAVNERHVTLGIGYQLSPKSNLDISYVQALKRSQVCAVSDGCRTLLTQQSDAFVAARMVIYAIGASWEYRF